MKELQEILEKVSNFAAGERAILATVVDVVGSGYRRAGARMLIDKNGFSIGTISGGCLEADVLERAKKVLETGAPTVVTYDTTKDETSLFGLGMGCRGIVRVLLEKVSHESLFFDYLLQVFEQRKSLTTATLISSNLSTQKIGSRLYFYNSEAANNDFKSEISDLIFEKIAAKNDGKLPTVESFEFGEIFFETIKPPINLLLFGAGYDAVPLLKFAKEIGWRVCVIDHRAAFANRERLPEADEIIVSRAGDLSEEFFEDENSVAVVMTHNYERDGAILPRLLHSKCQYVGALGPKTRAEKLLKESGEIFSNKQLSRLYAPIGLDIGADTPEEIALAIIAEIHSVLAKRNAGFLRERNGGIH